MRARVAENVLFALALLMFVALAALELTGHRLFVVTGASMDPAIPKGALVIVKATSPSALRVGDVVTFERRGEAVTHRIVEIEDLRIGDLRDGRVFTTRGDANEVADPDRIEFPGEVGLVRGHLALAGYAVASLHVYGRAALLLGSAAVLATSATLVARSRLAPAPASA
ncbi:MAG: signal peptidase I [Chloroflexota bacterium]